MLRGVLFLAIVLLASFHPSELKRIVLSGSAQGTTYQVSYFASDTLVSKIQIDSILNVIDSSMSLYKPYSTINKFNRSQSGCEIDSHFKKVVARSIEITRATNGSFDITIKPLLDLWGFGVKANNESHPNDSAISKARRCIGSSKIHLDDSRLRKDLPCIQIDLNGIAQGYTVDLLSHFLIQNRLNNHIVELGGEIRISGKRQPDGTNMRIGIEAPTENEFEEGSIQRVVELESGAVTTSGSYRKYHESKGKRVSHLFDAKTGSPVSNELISVTVMAPDAITADGFDNALMAMGLTKALNFVEQRSELSAYFIYKRKDGSVADTCSSRFPKFINL